MIVQPIPDAEAKKRWAIHDEAKRNGKQPAPKPVVGTRNAAAIANLNNTEFFHWRGRAYGVPPLPWDQGVQMLDAWLDAQKYDTILSRESLPGYVAVLRRLTDLIWKNVRPASPILRAMRACRLLPNPFRKATEMEIMSLAFFFLRRRMSTAVRFPMAEAVKAG